MLFAPRRRALLAAAALAPARHSRAQPGPAQPAAQAADLRFGVLFPLSGPLGLLGDECARGVELAAAARNAAGGVLGRPVRLLRTDLTDAAQAQAEVRRLAALGGAERPVALFGTLDTDLALAASQAAEVAGVPYLELVAGADALTERDFRMLFRNAPRATEMASTTLEAMPPLARLLGADSPLGLRLGLLHEDAPGPEALATLVATRGRDLGFAVGMRTAYRGQQPAEIVAALRRVRADGAMVLLHAGSGAAALPLFRALREERWRPRALVGLGGGYAVQDLPAALGAELDGTLVVDLPQPAIDERFAPGVGGFAETYRQRYGADPRSGHSLACHAGAMLFLDAVQRAGGIEAARIRAAILALDLPIGAQPNGWGARFDERGQNGRARTVVLQWRGGTLRTVLPREAAVAELALGAG
jgi:branched-chain amino acid transport system substrate-binding protein